MAQVEDTELRDLVIEALEKNGSLAKIRALLRANIFLAFEDEYENVKQNINLDNILNIPEGILALSIVHEFLESCNLKNTLFVYTSESRQDKEYKYEGKKVLADKFRFLKQDNAKEPILVTLIKSVSNGLGNKHHYEQIINKTYDKKDPESSIYKDEQNNSYIVHDDSQSSTTNTSQSDNSIDEKNKLHLRIQLDNSDTSDTSESSRDKSSSEYIPNNIAIQTDRSNKLINDNDPVTNDKNVTKRNESVPYFLRTTGNNSSDSTSYVELKPFSSFDEKMLNTTGLPHVNLVEKSTHTLQPQNEVNSRIDTEKSATSNSISSISIKNESNKSDNEKHGSNSSPKSNADTADYSNDFTISQTSKHKDEADKVHSPNYSGDYVNDFNKMVNSPIVSPHLNSHSSISISDVADLISEKSSSIEHHSNEKSLERDNKLNSPLSNHSKRKSDRSNKIYSDDSGDFTESPIPSLSNLSLDIHSD